jgi:hypothetical protein
MTTKVYIWYPSQSDGFHTMMGDSTAPDRWGHAGIKFKNLPSPYVNAYFSLYPSDVRWGPIPNGGVIRRDRHADMEDESCGVPGYSLPNRVYVCQNLSPDQERSAYDIWLGWQRNPPGYSAFGFNCCSAVAQSLGAESEMYTPQSLEAWILARHGIRDRF